jgi:CHAT domain-containing protein
VALVLAEPTPQVRQDGTRWESIPGTAVEAEAVATTLTAKGIHVNNMIDKQVTAQDVMNDLKNAHLFHISSHGSQDRKKPLDSCFVLHTEDLTIEKIKNADTPDALFAYLSACQTAAGDKNHPDQAVHLAASMLWCGFCGVLATMW